MRKFHVTEVPLFFVAKSKVAAGSEDAIFQHHKSKVVLGFHMLLVGMYAAALGHVWLHSMTVRLGRRHL